MTDRSVLPKVFLGSHDGIRPPVWRHHVLAMGIETEVLVVSWASMEEAIEKHPVLEGFREACRTHFCKGGAPICFVPNEEVER